MEKLNKKRLVITAFVGAIIFCLVVIVLDYILGRGFSWKRLTFYFPIAMLWFGFLTYRKFKKHNKK